MLKHQQIAFIGGGHIAEIIITNLVQEGGIPPENIIVSDPAESRCRQLADRFGIMVATDNVKAAESRALILICVRPEVVKAVLSDLQSARLSPVQVIVSVAAGVPLAAYKTLGNQQPLVRALPNPPSQVGQGIAPLVFSPAVTAEERQQVFELFSTLGDVIEVDETYLNAITSLSSPVATYCFFESLIEAGVSCGLPSPIAEKVAARTITGSMAVWGSRGVPPTELIREASTPGGVSVETVRTLEGHGFDVMIKNAITKGAARAEELGRHP